MDFLAGKTLEDLKLWLRESGEKEDYAVPLLTGFYRKKMRDIMQIAQLPLSLRRKLAAAFADGYYEPSHLMVSADGSRKYLFSAGEKGFVESVYLPERSRHTLCVSTQAGCRMGCAFCCTGQSGFRGNLTEREILNQVLSVPESSMLNRIVFMGMGEPFDNSEALFRVLAILTASWGLAFGAQKITVSTVGILPSVLRFLDETNCHLALSVHSPFPEERKKWIPAENKFPLKEIILSVGRKGMNRHRRITAEYVMMAGVNDSREHLQELIHLFRGTVFRINLIPFNPFEGSVVRPSEASAMQYFMKELNKAGISATIRRSRGTDISAACGQLGNSFRLSPDCASGAK
jgi:23S rRNA (adenine2503-C2)-methyltransferase